jgi:protein-L-isoaspartate(D-aspartate) O-methyltransferase
MNDLHFAAPRHEMVEEIAQHVRLTSDQIGRETLAEPVLAAMEKVPRHEFVPIELRGFAYVNSPLPIGYGKTISQPYMNALMADLLEAQPDDVVLEVGTGFGYHAAILAELVAKVYTIEIIEELVGEARKRLEGQGYTNIEMRTGDGALGWPEHAPFDRILVAAAPDLVPPALLQQLKPGGRMVIPAGIEDAQQLMVVDKSEDGVIDIREVLPVRFSELITDGEF